MKLTFKRATLFIVGLGVIYFCLFNHTPHGRECESSKSPDGLYMAERCLLKWVPGGDSKYVGRLFDARNGKLLAQHTFATPVPQVAWFNYEEIYVSFSIGDGGDDATYISIPPSKWDRLLAARPRL
jgi:hypothetical protein